MKVLLILARTLEKHKLSVSRSVLFRMKTQVSLKSFMGACRFIIAVLQGPVTNFYEA